MPGLLTFTIKKHDQYEVRYLFERGQAAVVSVLPLPLFEEAFGRRHLLNLASMHLNDVILEAKTFEA